MLEAVTTMAKWLIVLGLLLVLAGVVLHYVPAALHWFGRLPGDLHIESERFKVWIPFTSMLLISLILSLLLAIFRS